MLETGENDSTRKAQFHFERQWLLDPKFKDIVVEHMVETFLSHNFDNTIDMWQLMMAQLRKLFRGYGANVNWSNRMRKTGIKRLIQKLDTKVDL
jgi:hypothetical protein